jgi:hypothetical protein
MLDLDVRRSDNKLSVGGGKPLHFLYPEAALLHPPVLKKLRFVLEALLSTPAPNSCRINFGPPGQTFVNRPCAPPLRMIV